MKRKFQKLLALVMAMAMCLSLLQTTAFATETDANAHQHTYSADKVSYEWTDKDTCVATFTCTDGGDSQISVTYKDGYIGDTKNANVRVAATESTIGNCTTQSVYNCTLDALFSTKGQDEKGALQGDTFKVESNATVKGPAASGHKAGTTKYYENITNLKYTTDADGKVTTQPTVLVDETKSGSYDVVTYCENIDKTKGENEKCGAEVSRTTVTVKATGHSYETARYKDGVAQKFDTEAAAITAYGFQWILKSGAVVTNSTVLTVDNFDGEYRWSAKCTNCGEVNEASGKATRNSLTASCGESGKIWYTVTLPDGTEVTSQEIVTDPASTSKSHSWGETAQLANGIYYTEDGTKVEVKAATCTKTGLAVWAQTCSNCGRIKVSKRQELNKDTNNHGELTTSETITTKPTCGVDGYKTVKYTCKDCNTVVKTETVVVPATGKHNLGAVVEAVTAPCAKATGATANAKAAMHPAYQLCSVCGKYVSDGIAYTKVSDMPGATTEPTADHTYKVTVSTSSASDCTSKTGNATIVKECTTCGEKTTSKVSGTNHTVYNRVITTAGATTGANANDAQKQTNYTAIDAISFTYTDSDVVEATCTTTGSFTRTYKCPDCGDSLSSVKVIVPALHDAANKNNTRVVKSVYFPNTVLSTLQNYSVVYGCSKCDATLATVNYADKSLSAKEKAALPAATRVAVAATCAAPSAIYYDVTVGGVYAKSTTVTIGTAKDPSNHVGFKVTTAATCTTAGVETCTGCGATQEIAATGKHNFVKTASTAATYTKQGSITYTCSDCGEVVVDKIAKKTLAKGTIKSLTAKKGKKVVVKFKKVTGAKKYRIAWSYNGTKWTMNDTTKTSITLKNLKAGKKLRVKVRAIAGSNKGDYSAVKKVTVKK